ncbi:MAG TPA: ascorbate-dependent monooxygenase [Solibacterales bacterium]|nr:ascorbate-dependent monooxygenase [Bryobacterales bacterium]
MYRAVLFAICLSAAAGTAGAQPTFSKEVSRILQAKCQNCHRPKDIAPFALLTYGDASTWAADIARVVREGIMPPWKPVPGHGEFRDSFGLTDEERETLIRWAEGGAPEGDPADLPEPMAERGEWALGEPDLVLTMAEAYTPPRGKDMYRCFVLPTPYDSDRWVTAVDVLPGDRSVVHHAILYLDTTGEAERLDAAEEGPGYTCYGGPGTPIFSDARALAAGGTLGGWAPGARPHHLPEGIGMTLPAGARIVLQLHYYSTRVTAEDQTRIGLYFAKTDVERRLTFLPIVPLDSRGRVRMEIPAGAERHEVQATFATPPLALFNLRAIHVFPHMHLLGKEIRLDVRRNGEWEPMILIDKWDFNWQGSYTYQSPVSVPGGATLRLRCTYDNSTNNPRNPNAVPKLVTWGEGTEDEMCLAFLGVVFERSFF